MDFLVQLAELDGESLVMLAFGVALAGLLFGVAESWRRIQREVPGLPVWRAFEQAGIPRARAEERIGSRAAREAELRCVVCPGRTACAARQRVSGVPGDCPNYRILTDLI